VAQPENNPTLEVKVPTQLFPNALQKMEKLIQLSEAVATIRKRVARAVKPHKINSMNSGGSPILK